MTRFLERALEGALGGQVRIERVTRLSGGCIHEVRRLVTNKGDFFAKWSESVPSEFFLGEASGLEAMAGVESGLVTPRVVAASPGTPETPAFLILEYLDPCPSQEAQDERLGRGLALLHRSTARSFGFARNTYCGATPQDNTWTASWPEFFGARRLAPLVETLRRKGLPADRALRYETFIGRLGDWLPGSPSPSLIHGDLWAGNVLVSARGPALIDPACAYADREMEFGITTLFGGLTERAFDAYEEEWPLLHGWRERNALYRLYHLLNHAVLFGGSYEAEAFAIVRRLLG